MNAYQFKGQDRTTPNKRAIASKSGSLSTTKPYAQLFNEFALALGITSERLLDIANNKVGTSNVTSTRSKRAIRQWLKENPA